MFLIRWKSISPVNPNFDKIQDKGKASWLCVLHLITLERNFSPDKKSCLPVIVVDISIILNAVVWHLQDQSKLEVWITQVYLYHEKTTLRAKITEF